MRIIEDIRVYSKGSKVKAVYTVLFNPNFHAVLLYRIANLLSKFKIGKSSILLPLVKIIIYLNRILFSVDIDYRADLAGGFNLIHGIGTIIGLDVKTEGRVNIYQGVTLGGNNNKKKKNTQRTYSQPWLMNNVTLFANSTIIGPCIIGENTIIGANSFVSESVESNVTIYCKVEMKLKNN